MPLFTYQCKDCKEKQEKFQHKPEEKEVLCKKCGAKCQKTIGLFANRNVLGSKDNFAENIEPEIERIKADIDSGKDGAFLDLYGEK